MKWGFSITIFGFSLLFNVPPLPAFTFHRPLKSAIALTWQNIITSPVFIFRGEELLSLDKTHDWPQTRMILSLNNSHVTKEMHSVSWNTAPALSARLSDYVRLAPGFLGPSLSLTCHFCRSRHTYGHVFGLIQVPKVHVGHFSFPSPSWVWRRHSKHSFYYDLNC